MHNQRAALTARSRMMRMASPLQTGRRVSGWYLVPVAMAVLLLLPLAVLGFSWRTVDAGIWGHLWQTQLLDLFANTFWLAVGVGCGTALIGVSLAWLTAVCEFPGRGFFAWALLLPLAMPTYVLAFVYLGLLDYAGPVQSLVRDLLGADVAMPEMRGRGMLIVTMCLALYPYVYLLARNAFATQGRRLLEAGATLGATPVQGFRRIALPVARPWILGGLALVLMETVADFGAVSVFNYNTFTTAIYKAWFGFFSIETAAQLASLLVLIVLVLVSVEQVLRNRRRYASGRPEGRAQRMCLRGWQRWIALGWSAVVFCLAFVVPVMQLALWAMRSGQASFSSSYWEVLGNSLMLGALAAVLISLTALLLAYANRRHPGTGVQPLTRLATLGYALPGAVLAVGMVVPMASVDAWIGSMLGRQGFALFQGTLLAMMLAYLVRFMAVGYKAIDSSMCRLSPNLDEAARLLGSRGLKRLRRVHLPLVRGGMVTALTLVFVDVMKEMPMTLMTRPFGWDTLATRIFELTSEAEWERASVPALSLLLAGMVPVLLFLRPEEEQV